MSDKTYNIIPYDGELEGKSEFAKMKLTEDQKIHISALINQMPAMNAAGTLSKAYTVEFPDGLPHSLMNLKRGGKATPIQDSNGKILGSASLHELDAQAVALGAFTVVSVATSQYFLSKINGELKMLKLNIDRILEFLYGEKKAELMAELSFAKYAYQNYISIMEHSEQRTATLTSIQEARKIAMKDIEFYMSDLDSSTSMKSGAKITDMVEDSFRIKECLELSIQLYVMSTLLEIFYAQNFDSNYLKRVEADVISYAEKCDKRILSCFSGLKSCIEQHKAKPLEKISKEELAKPIYELIDNLNSGEDSDIRKAVHASLGSVNKAAVYYFTQEGNVYRKIA